MSHKRKIIYLAGFVFSLSVALMSYINSSFLASFIPEKYVGAVYTFASIGSIIALLLVPLIFRKIGGYEFLLSVIALNALSIWFLAFSANAASAIIFFILNFTFTILIYFSLDELLKIFSKESSIGETRGIYLAFSSLAWIIAQLLLGAILGGFSLKTVYLGSFAAMIGFFYLSYFFLDNILDPKYDRVSVKKYLGIFFKNKNLARSFGLSFLLYFFYCWMIIYTPIYLSLHLGFSWKEIGMIFAVMLLPFVIIPFHLGKYADKIGERKMLIFGFATTSLATLSLFLIQERSLWLWAILLFATRVGAASVEIMVDAYFFKHIRPENEELVGVFRMAPPVAYIISPLIAFMVFSFVPSFNFIYIVLGAIMLAGVYLSSTIKLKDI